MKLSLALLLVAFCALALGQSREFTVQRALIYNDPFVTGALYVNVEFDDFMPDSATNPGSINRNGNGKGVMILEYLDNNDAVVMTEVYDYTLKYLFQFCTTCDAVTKKQEMPRFYNDPAYYTAAAVPATEIVDGTTCTGRQRPGVTGAVSSRIYVDGNGNPCRHYWANGKTIDFLTSDPANAQDWMTPGNNNIGDTSIITVGSSNEIRPNEGRFSWATTCPTPTCRVKIDLVAVMDDSGSVDSSEFAQERDFVYNLMDQFAIGPDDVRGAVVKFARSAQLSIALNDNKPNLLTQIANLPKGGGSTCIGCGMQVALGEINNNGRSSAECVMVVLTDGYNNQQTSAFPGVVSSVHAHPCEVFGIGIGGGFLESTINSFVSPPIADHKFLVNGFGGLGAILSSVATAACPEIPGSLCGPGCQGLCLCGTTCQCPSTCDDFNPCTEEACVNGQNANACAYSVTNCNPTLDLCNLYSCDPVNGCVDVPRDCDDNDVCTVDNCIADQVGCTSAPIDCDDQNPCTTDSCDPTMDPNDPDFPCRHVTGDCAKCINQVDSTQGNTLFVDCSLARFNPRADLVTPCNPAACNPNSANDRYDTSDGALTNADDGPCEFAPVNCDDGNPCTYTICDLNNGICTLDVSQGVNGFFDCNDNNECTIDSCDGQAADPLMPCVNTPIDAAVTCFDGNPCTQDLCVPATGCSNDVPTDCSSFDECLITDCVPNQGGCTVDTQSCVPSDNCHISTCIPKNEGGVFVNTTFCVETEIEGTINECGECLGNDVSCFIEGSDVLIPALAGGIIAAIVIAVIIAVALGVFGAKKGYDYYKHRGNGGQNFNEPSAVYKAPPSGTNAAHA